MWYNHTEDSKFILHNVRLQYYKLAANASYIYITQCKITGTCDGNSAFVTATFILHNVRLQDSTIYFRFHHKFIYITQCKITGTIKKILSSSSISFILHNVRLQGKKLIQPIVLHLLFILHNVRLQGKNLML